MFRLVDAPRTVRFMFIGLALWLAAGELGNLLFPGGPHQKLYGLTGQTVVILLCALLTGLRAARLNENRRPWALLSLGMACWGAGNAYWSFVLIDQDHIPVPSPADIGYLLFPVLAAPALLGMARSSRRLQAGAWFDAIVASLAVASLCTAIVWPLFASVSHAKSAEIFVGLAYPVTDLLLLGAIVGASARAGWDISPRWATFAAGILLFVIADCVYAVDNLNGGYLISDWYNLGWTGGMLLLSLASWLPATRGSNDHAVRHLTMSAGFALIALGVLAFGAVGSLPLAAAALACAALLALLGRLVVTLRENVGMLATSQEEAITDLLTGLGNRRGLVRAMDELLANPDPAAPVVLAIFDLDGFKTYNDTFGHPAGDALLARLGERLGAHVAGSGSAYRMGGDEFCALLPAPAHRAEELSAAAAQVLTERGEGFYVGCSFGCVIIPMEADDATEAMRTADHRLYAAKNSGRRSAGRQSSDVLLRALIEHSPELEYRLNGVAVMAEAVAVELGLTGEDLEQVRRAAELHDVGNVAIPDEILAKAGPLDASEWAFVERHTIIGERILASAPALSHCAQIVRSSHERWDGKGYPDLLAGDAIPLGARIVFVAAAFDAMTRSRPHRTAMSVDDALAELCRASGSQFDPAVVAVFVSLAAAQPAAALAPA